MSRVLLSTLCGLFGGIVAVAAAAICFYRRLPGSGYVKISRSEGGPEIYKELEVLDHASRPQGLYVRFKNTGLRGVEMTNFRVRGYKDGKLWVEFEEAVYSEVSPGMEQEAILKLRDYRDGSETLDPSDCRIEVAALYGYAASTKRA